MRIYRAIVGFAVLISLSPALAQTHTTIHHRRVETTESSPAADLVKQAEAEIAGNRFAQAEPLLQQAVAKDPKDFQAWYDLGFVQNALHKNTDAISDYEKSVELNPAIFESNLNLGLLLAKQGENVRAVKYLRAATRLQPSSQAQTSIAQAWLALGNALQNNDAAQALEAYRHASQLGPQDPLPHFFSAQLLEKQEHLEQAQSEYKQAASLGSGEEKRAALSGLVNTAIARRSPDQAESALRDYLRENPGDGTAHLLLGRILATENKNQEALAELESANNGSGPEVQREKAELLAGLQQYEEAAAIYKKLVEQNPQDARLRHQYGIMLMKQHHFDVAQSELLAALKLDPSMVAAYGDLAVTASENQQYPLAIQVLDARAKIVPETAATHFLRATAYDHLRQYPLATAEYRQFLAVADGKHPDQEWQARHRLVAIEKLK